MAAGTGPWGARLISLSVTEHHLSPGPQATVPPDHLPEGERGRICVIPAALARAAASIGSRAAGPGQRGTKGRP